jgi:hypothetical protein
MKLWTWHVDCGRMGELTGAFFATEEELAHALGYEIWLDEPLGKHSEIEVELERDQFEALEISDQSVAVITEKFGTTLSGFNPVEIAEDQLEENGD